MFVFSSPQLSLMQLVGETWRHDLGADGRPVQKLCALELAGSHTSPGGLVKTQVQNAIVGLGPSQRFCLSNKLLGDAGPLTTL